KILVKVTEVNPNQIKYTYCDSPNETQRTINKADINYIVYSNGYKEVYSSVQQGQAQSQVSNDNYNKQHRARNLAIIGLIFLIVGIILCLLLFIPSLGIGASILGGSANAGCSGCFSLFFGIIFSITGIILLIIALATSVST
ncbi:MAG TPA: hypothetical protein VF411_15930, partial [Bacteroidia bacterium]